MSAGTVFFDPDGSGEAASASTHLAADTVFAHALAGEPCLFASADWAVDLPVRDWTRSPDADDLGLVDLCAGATLDVGCGPGRLTHALGARGLFALGIDVVGEAVRSTRARGAIAMCRDVFGPVPRAGSWSTVLLADGNIGIGGDPVALLARVRTLLAPGGRVVVEVGPPGSTSGSGPVHLRCPCGRSHDFPWAFVALDALDDLARASGLEVTERHRLGGRWAAVLRVAPPGAAPDPSPPAGSSGGPA